MKNDRQTSFDKFRSWLKANLYIGVGKSLFLWFLGISFVPLLAVSFINYLVAYAGLTVVAEKSLVTTSQLRVEYLNTFFQEVTNYLEVQANLNDNIDFLKTLKKYEQESELALEEFVQCPVWDSYTADQQNDLTEFTEKHDYYNIYYIDRDGKILFALKHQDDLGTNLFKGPYSGSLFSKTCEEILKTGKTLFSDLEIYEPSGGILAGFFGHPIRDANEEIIGLLAIQITMDRINKIIQDDVGLGETGEAYLVGPDLKMRSTTRFNDESVILNQSAQTDKTLTWQKYIRNKDDEQYIRNNELDKETISIYQNKDGIYVLGIYRHLGILDDLGIQWALIEEIEHSEAFAYAQQLSDIAKVSFIITIIIVFFIAILVTRKFVNPIKKLSAWAKQVAMGVLKTQQVRAPKNEVGEMVDTFNNLVESLHSYAEVSESAAYGDYTRKVMVRSQGDVLGKSMNQMVESFKKVVEQANQIASGDYSTNVVPRGDKDTLGIALYEMTKKLRDTSKEMNEQDWLKTGISKLESTLSGLKDLAKLTGEVISFLVQHLDAQLGLIYSAENNTLSLTAAYAFKIKDKKFRKFEFGEGLIGQAAQEKRVITFNEPQDQLPGVNYGTGESRPLFTFIAPFVFEGDVKGVILIGSFKEMTGLQRKFLEMCLDSIAIAMNSVQAHERVENLLTQTQEQAHELQVQQEELREANEELEEQTKALKHSEENLKNQQEELRVINEELEERTNDLEIERDNIRKKNEELKLAQEEIKQKAMDLEIASQYKSEFLANMSHELRTPLNSILVLSQLLADNKKEHLDNKEIEFSKTINSSGRDLLDLINEILDLSKVEAGKLELYVEESYISEITNFINRTFKPLTDEKGLNLKIEVADDIPELLSTDSQRVMQILKNLFSNAIKFTSNGTISLSISRPDKTISLMTNGLTHENSIAFSVSDTGIGIPKDKLKLIFDAFRQADGTTSRKYGGTGLGLTISQSFSILLGGELHVASEAGKGSVFTLILPDSVDKPVIESVSKDKPSPANQTRKKSSAGKKKTGSSPDPVIGDDKNNLIEGDNIILVIEDDMSFCKVLYDLAHEKRFKCLLALDGETGLHYADYYQPAAIILDLGLPGIDGYEVMERLKENPKTRHIPIHIISASEKSLDAMKMGAIGYLTKPVSNETLDEVFTKIANIISRPVRKALIVEDDTIMRKSIVNLLDDGNVSITAVESGEEALKYLQKEKYECLILDLGLKELSGYDLLERLRKEKKLKDLPIIIYTGQDLTKEDDEKLHQYADSIILKGAKSFERLLSEATLFLHQVQGEMPEDKQQMLKTLQTKEDILSDKKILIVDDDMRNVFALSSVLEENGLKVVIAKNGREGIERLHDNPDVDLVLMDIMMPEMDGYEAMINIRKDEKYDKLPIIALTAKAMKEDRAKCIAAGANDYLAKPVKSDKLLSLLRVWLYNK